MITGPTVFCQQSTPANRGVCSDIFIERIILRYISQSNFHWSNGVCSKAKLFFVFEKIKFNSFQPATHFLVIFSAFESSGTRYTRNFEVCVYPRASRSRRPQFHRGAFKQLICLNGRFGDRVKVTRRWCSCRLLLSAIVLITVLRRRSVL